MDESINFADYLRIESHADPETSQVQFNLNSRIWLGTHYFIILGINGQPNSSPDARGDSGLFNSLQS